MHIALCGTHAAVKSETWKATLGTAAAEAVAATREAAAKYFILLAGRG